MTEFDPIDDLIGKVLANEATSVEREQLNQWIQESEKNAHYFNQLKIVFEKAASSRVKIRFDEDKAWNNIRSKITQEKHFFLNVTFTRVAAGIALLAGAYLFYLSIKPNVETLVVKTSTETKENILPDGSVVFANRNSSVAYEFNSSDKVRNVKLNGEAYFEVKHEEAKPFVINTANEVFIKDIGTAFNVKAYASSDTIIVTVESGEVQFYTLKDSGLLLKAGEAGIYSKSLKTFSKLAKADTNALAYKTKIFNFKDTELKRAVEMINDVYHSKIKLGNQAIGNCKLTVSFNNDKIEDIVEIIAETLGLRVEKKKNAFLLDGTGCVK